MANQLDKFGIKHIYATRVGAREWFLRDSVSDIKNDSRVDGDLADDLADSGNSTDGFTVKDNGQVRLKVCPESTMRGYRNTGLDQGAAKGRGYMSSSKEWDIHGLECTIRLKCTAVKEDEADFILKGPTGSHTSNTDDCSGSSYNTNFYLAQSGNWAGKTEFKKEQWHVHYKTRTNSLKSTGLGHIFNKWVVLKYIIYLVKDSSGKFNHLKMEAWINSNDDGVTFKKVNETLDTGGWGDAATECDADRDDEIMTWRAPFIIWRWDGNSIKFKALSVREIDPSRFASDVGAGEDPQSPSTGTVFKDYIFRYNIIDFPVDACALGIAADTFKAVYNVDHNNSQSNLHRDRHRVGVLCNGSASDLIGKKPRKILVRLSKTGSPPSGNITCVIRRGNDDEVVATFTYTGGGGNLNATSLTGTITDYEFENLTSNYVLAAGDRINIEYSANTVDTTNEVNVWRSDDDPFNGANTCAIKFDSGGPPPTAYSSPDIFRDYAWIIYEATGGSV